VLSAGKKPVRSVREHTHAIGWLTHEHRILKTVAIAITVKVRLKLIMAWNKYKAQKTKVSGYSFGSKLEAQVFLILKAREQAGEISSITIQDSVYLTKARIQYIADFRFINNSTGEMTWCEAKGMELPQWRIKRKLWMFYGPGDLEVYMGNWQKPFLKEIIKVEKEA
jgi:hypothetical protein